MTSPTPIENPSPAVDADIDIRAWKNKMNGNPAHVSVRSVNDFRVTLVDGGMLTLFTSATEFLADDNEQSQLSIFTKHGRLAVQYGNGKADFSSVAKHFGGKERDLLERRLHEIIERDWRNVEVDFNDSATWDGVEGLYNLDRGVPAFTTEDGRIELYLGDLFRLLEQDDSFEFVQFGGVQELVMKVLDDFGYDTTGVATR
jgi:hypothetical protein